MSSNTEFCSHNERIMTAKDAQFEQFLQEVLMLWNTSSDLETE